MPTWIRSRSYLCGALETIFSVVILYSSRMINNFQMSN